MHTEQKWASKRQEKRNEANSTSSSGPVGGATMMTARKHTSGARYARSWGYCTITRGWSRRRGGCSPEGDTYHVSTLQPDLLQSSQQPI